MIPYTKLSSQGNDFILIESCDLHEQLDESEIIRYSDRKSIGCDQFFVIDSSNLEHIYCKVYNSDGSEACQCGNGLRAVMLFLKNKYELDSANLIICEKKYYSKVDGNDIEVDMGTPKYIDIDFSKVKNRYDIKKEGILYHITHLNISFTFLPIFIGNSHCVVFAENMELHHRQKICNILDDIYNCSMNIGFVSNKSNFLHDPNIPLQLIVRERGAGYTKSCGSGATAAAIAMFKLYELENESRVEASKITINQEGGDLSVRKNYNPDTFVLIGPSKILSTGELNE